MAAARLPLPVVAIGASAGGLEALMELLPLLTPNGRTRLILAQHMAKTGHADLVVRVLSRKATLRVVEAEDGVAVQPDTLYVLPPGYDGAYDDGHLQLLAPQLSHHSTPSVNVLFSSVARAAGEDALAVVLSGAGSDGVAGCRSIRAHGGHVVVQGEASTAIHGMPGAVEREGLADEVLAPIDIARRINTLLPTRAAVPPALPPHPHSGSAKLQVLLERMSESAGVDFTMYRQGTLLRRMERRCQSLGLPDLNAYIAFALAQPEELETLQRLFLISWSWFYRDRAAFDSLAGELATLLKSKPAGEAFTAWVPGCATGEECYSLAMVVRHLDPAREIRVIGSDLNDSALTTARAARYPEQAFRELPGELRSANTRVDGDHFRVSDHIRELCSFRHEDVLGAAPNDAFDLVSCRNLLIYMKRELHAQLLGVAFQTLRPNGLLFLGLSEGLGREEAVRFSTVDATHRIYRRRALT